MWWRHDLHESLSLDFKDEDQKKIKESFNSDQISDEDKDENKIEEYANEDKFADTHSDVNSQQLTRDTSDDVISDKLGIKEDFTEEWSWWRCLYKNGLFTNRH